MITPISNNTPTIPAIKISPTARIFRNNNPKILQNMTNTDITKNRINSNANNILDLQSIYASYKETCKYREKEEDLLILFYVCEIIQIIGLTSKQHIVFEPIDPTHIAIRYKISFNHFVHLLIIEGVNGAKKEESM